MASFFHDAHNTVWRLGLSGGGALDQVFGVDLNALAVAIARFLLLLARCMCATSTDWLCRLWARSLPSWRCLSCCSRQMFDAPHGLSTSLINADVAAMLLAQYGL
jgi:hypothetical protein